jgi:hypothetical protein
MPEQGMNKVCIHSTFTTGAVASQPTKVSDKLRLLLRLVASMFDDQTAAISARYHPK